MAIVVAPDDLKGTLLMLEPTDNPIAKTYQTQLYAANIPCMVFSVDDMEQEYIKMKEKGIIFRKAPKRTEWGMEAVFEDTCGNLIQLHQV
jgi:predicted enzyme related to lactoylglutathione lyase